MSKIEKLILGAGIVFSMALNPLQSLGQTVKKGAPDSKKNSKIITSKPSNTKKSLVENDTLHTYAETLWMTANQDVVTDALGMTPDDADTVFVRKNNTRDNSLNFRREFNAEKGKQLLDIDGYTHYDAAGEYTPVKVKNFTYISDEKMHPDSIQTNTNIYGKSKGQNNFDIQVSGKSHVGDFIVWSEYFTSKELKNADDIIESSKELETSPSANPLLQLNLHPENLFESLRPASGYNLVIQAENTEGSDTTYIVASYIPKKEGDALMLYGRSLKGQNDVLGEFQINSFSIDANVGNGKPFATVLQGKLNPGSEGFSVKDVNLKTRKKTTNHILNGKELSDMTPVTKIVPGLSLQNKK